ncbi:MAG: hypothetical protein R3F60_17125 [bacterium]
MDPPFTMPLWSLDEASNVWVQEGEATWDDDAQVYVGHIGHMSMWNCDQPATATCITGHVTDTAGEALPGARVTARGADYNGSTSAVAGDDGRFYIAVRKDSSVAVLASHAAGGGTSTSCSPATRTPRCRPRATRAASTWASGWWSRASSAPPRAARSPATSSTATRSPAPAPRACWRCSPASRRPAPAPTSRWAPAPLCAWSNGAGLVTTQGATASRRATRGPAAASASLGGLDFNPDTRARRASSPSCLTNGQTYTILQDEDDTRWGVRCPNGQEAYFDRADQEALEACGVGGDSGGPVASARCAGFPSAGGAGEAGGGGGQPGLCRGDGECSGGTICCQPDPNQPEIGVCHPGGLRSNHRRPEHAVSP